MRTQVIYRLRSLLLLSGISVISVLSETRPLKSPFPLYPYVKFSGGYDGFNLFFRSFSTTKLFKTSGTDLITSSLLLKERLFFKTLRACYASNRKSACITSKNDSVQTPSEYLIRFGFHLPFDIKYDKVFRQIGLDTDTLAENPRRGGIICLGLYKSVKCQLFHLKPVFLPLTNPASYRITLQHLFSLL
jgi:hypothetical protein